MSRNRFEAILSNLHANDNNAINDDRYYKVRPLFSHLNNVSKLLPFKEDLAIDESMVRYYGRHRGKQYMIAKPIKFGFKVWSLASTDGYLYHAEPYAGAKAQIKSYGLGLGGDVVISLIEKCGISARSHIYMDNFFTSLRLLDALNERHIHGTGTIRANRLEKCPLMDKNTIGKQQRGYSEEFTDGKVCVVQWLDNRNAITASNKYGCGVTKCVKRWCKSTKAYIQVPVPEVFAHYNKHMGGVDIFNQSIAAYRIKIRSRKWYYSLFSWIFNALLVNSWRFYQDTRDPRISQLDYLRQVVIALLFYYGATVVHTGH